MSSVCQVCCQLLAFALDYHRMRLGCFQIDVFDASGFLDRDLVLYQLLEVVTKARMIFRCAQRM